MKKSDLKTGMMVVTRNNHNYMVMLNVEYDATRKTIKPQDVIVSDDGWMPLSKYSDDLRVYGSFCELDIIAVYSPIMQASLWRKDLSDKNDWVCIWKREEPPVEMTVAEIEKKLGIKNLKIIKEHKDE